MKKLILNFLSHKVIARKVIRLLLLLDGYLYKMISFFAVAAEGGVHPKHNIINYHLFFLENVNTDSVVLDIGCNTGTLLYKLAPYIKCGYGIEIIEKYTDLAIKNNIFSNISFYHGDATLFDYTKFHNINVITLSNVLEHIEDRIDFLSKLVAKLKAQSKLDSVILIRIPLITRDWLACYKKNLGIDYRLDPTHFIEYTEQDILSELESCGLLVESSKIRFGEMFLKCRLINA